MAANGLTTAERNRRERSEWSLRPLVDKALTEFRQIHGYDLGAAEYQALIVKIMTPGGGEILWRETKRTSVWRLRIADGPAVVAVYDRFRQAIVGFLSPDLSEAVNGSPRARAKFVHDDVMKRGPAMKSHTSPAQRAKPKPKLRKWTPPATVRNPKPKRDDEKRPDRARVRIEG